MASRLIPVAWYRWSDGSEMVASARAGMKRLMRKTKLRRAGETLRERFVRLRAVIEAGMRKRAEQAAEAAD